MVMIIKYSVSFMNLVIAHSICTGILLLAFVQPACSGDYSRLGWLPYMSSKEES